MSDLATNFFAEGARRRYLAGAMGFACLLLSTYAASAQNNPTNQANSTNSTNAPQMRLQVVDAESGQPVS
ncbi:MAG TPA: hypothetical protein VK731_09285, partial [Candidatus Cybelea sp.]|nr:hypothetical protein [Candidatus Cybelea sp.]